MNQDVENLIQAKVVVLGNTGVGKTCMVSTYVTGNFPHGSSPTIGAAYLSKDIDISSHRIKLMIWDTAGQERFRSMAPIYYRGADVGILVFDTNDESSLDAVRLWITELKSAPGVPQNIILVIAANKVDEDEEVDPATSTSPLIQEALDLAENQGATLFVTSAKTKIGLGRLFMHVAKKLLENFKQNAIQQNNPQAKLRLQREEKETKSCC